ncbi:MAG: ABC transporter permease [Deltaproteobacteria bacterium]|nr:ABC transporter permease [Deltaproteobacteria bacterium]
MELASLAFRTLRRHPLRSLLTALGIAVALTAFVLIRTIIGAWYSGVEASVKDRLIVRNAVSLVFYLPQSYQAQIEQIPGVELVGHGNWFGGKFRDEEMRFQQFAVDEHYVDIYSEYQTSPQERESWDKNRKGLLVGQSIADTYGVKPGDNLRLTGTIFPGDWDFEVSGVFKAQESGKDTRIMYFHYDYLNERNKAELGRQPDQVGFYVVRLKAGANVAEIAKAIDEKFANSFAETLTETETAFIQGFVSMSSGIIAALNAVSVVVVLIMLLVLSNTTLMSFRERYREFSVLNALGFSQRHLSLLVVGEAAVLSSAGFVLLLIALTPVFLLPAKSYLGELVNFFPVFRVSMSTLAFAVALAIGAALIAAFPPLLALRRMKVTDGLRLIH